MNWFYQQSRRDQIALILCGLCVGLYLIWMLGLKPLASANEASVNRYLATSESLARVKNLAATLKHYQLTAQQTPTTQQVSIASLIDSSTKENGLSFVTLNPSRDGQEATVRFDNVNLSNLVGWLHQLENQYSTQVEDLNLVAGNESGKVLATIRLRKL